MRYKLNLIILFIVSFFMAQCSSDKKNIEGEIKVVNNSDQPKEGTFDLITGELFTLGMQKDNSKYLFTHVRNVDLDKNDNLFVLDYAGKFFVFDKNGSYVKQFGQKGSGPGDMGVNTDFAITSDGRIVLADAVNYRFSYYDLTGKYLNLIKTKSFLNNIQLDKNDNLYSRWQDFDRADVAKKGRPNKTIRYKLIVTACKYNKGSDAETVLSEFKGSEEQITVINGGINSDGFINECVWKISPKDFYVTGFADTYLFSKYDLDGKLIGQFGRKYSKVVDRNSKKGPEDSPYLPVFTQYSLFDADGNFWVNLNTGDKPEYYTYDVFSPDGIYLKQVNSKYLIKKFKNDRALSVTKSDKGEMLVKAFKYSLKKRD
jgi:hypothetical protein